MLRERKHAISCPHQKLKKELNFILIGTLLLVGSQYLSIVRNFTLHTKSNLFYIATYFT